MSSSVFPMTPEGSGSTQRSWGASAQGLTGRCTLRLYSDRSLRAVFAVLATAVVIIAAGLLTLFFVNWLRTSSHSAELLSKMRNAALVIDEPLQLYPSYELSDEQRTKIVERNLFNTRAAPTPTPPPQVEDEGPTRVNTDFELLGTFYSGPRSEAIIENKQSREQDAFRIGERVFDEAVLEAVYADRVELRRGRELEVLHMAMMGRGGGGVSAANVDETITIDGRELEDALDNLPLLLTQARAVPFFQDGQPVGLRLFAIRDGSLYQKAGLRNGDILRSVNGNSLADISKAAKLFEMLRDERSIVLEMERSRQARTVQYTIR